MDISCKKKLSKIGLAQALQNEMQMRYPGNEFIIVGTDQSKEVRIDIIHLEEKVFSCGVDSLFSTYQNAPQQLQGQCNWIFSTIDALLLDTKDEHPTLLPIIVNKNRLNEIQKNHLQDKYAGLLKGDPSLPYIPLNIDLFAIFALDTSHHIQYLFLEQLSTIFPNASLKTVLNNAKENLKKKLPELQIIASPIGFTLQLDSNYEASMLLIYDQWRDRLPFKSAPVIAIAARDTVVIADSEHAQQVKTLYKMLRETYHQVQDSISNQLFTIRNGRLEIYEFYPI